MKKLTRDETEHGQHYYLSSVVDKALAQPPLPLQEQLDKVYADWRKVYADRDKAYADWRKANADRDKANADRDKANAAEDKANADILKADSDWPKAAAEVARIEKLIKEQSHE
jgi:hypothetical protein